VACHRSGSVFQESVWAASKASNSTSSGRASRSACESWIGTESSCTPCRMSVGVLRSAVLAVQSKDRSGMLRGRPARRASGRMLSHGTAR